MNAPSCEPTPATTTSCTGPPPRPLRLAATLTAAPVCGARARLLYVDDDAQLRRLGCQVLGRSGYRVDAAADGEEAWSALLERPYDLMITDFQMPRLSGPELIRRVREAGMRLPVLIASGSLAMLSPGELRLMGNCATLPKPFDTRRLLEHVAELLTRPTANNIPNPNGPTPETSTFPLPLRHQGLNE